MESASVVAIKPKPAFLPLFSLREPVTAGSKILVIGDPEGGMGSAITNCPALGRPTAGQGCAGFVNCPFSATAWQEDARS